MKDRLRAIIVGAGVIGASVACELARDGRFDTTLIERNGAIGVGSTSASTAIIRQYYRHGESVKLARSGLNVWTHWGEWLGGKAPSADQVRFRQVGMLWVFPEENRDDETPHIERCERLGAQLEVLSHDALRARFPDYAFPDEPRVFGLYEPDGGYVEDPTQATRNLFDAAQASDSPVEALLNAEVVGFDHDHRRIHHIVVQRDMTLETLEADVVVNASGPHSYIVNAMARCPLVLTTVPNRQQLVDSRETALAWQSREYPVCADFVGGFYMKPDAERFRIGATLPKDEDDFLPHPDFVDPDPSRDFVEEKTAGARQRIPTVQLADIRGRVGVYDVTAADWKPILDKTEVDGYYVAVGTSGAWFKGAPVIGRVMRDLIVANSIDGRDTDEDPLTVALPYTDQPFALNEFSRRRVPHATGGVIG